MSAEGLPASMRYVGLPLSADQDNSGVEIIYFKALLVETPQVETQKR